MRIRRRNTQVIHRAGLKPSFAVGDINFGCCDTRKPERAVARSSSAES